MPYLIRHRADVLRVAVRKPAPTSSTNPGATTTTANSDGQQLTAPPAQVASSMSLEAQTKAIMVEIFPKWTTRLLDEWHAHGSRMNPNGTISRGCWGA